MRPTVYHTRMKSPAGRCQASVAPPDVETRLQQVASAHGKDPEQLVKDTVARMLENQARFVAGVQKGIEQAQRGEVIEHQEVVNRIHRLVRGGRPA